MHPFLSSGRMDKGNVVVIKDVFREKTMRFFD